MNGHSCCTLRRHPIPHSIVRHVGWHRRERGEAPGGVLRSDAVVWLVECCSKLRG